MTRPLPLRIRGNTDRSAFSIYASEVQRYKVMTREEEIAVAQRARSGDQQAIAHLMMANQRYVLKIANTMTGRGVDLEDLVQAGNIGLLRAINKFDPARGCKLITYATDWIKEYMRKYVCSFGISHVKFGTTQKQRRIYGRLPIARMLLAKKQLPETPENLAREIGDVTVKDVMEVEQRLRPDISLDAPRKRQDSGGSGVTATWKPHLRLVDERVLPEEAVLVKERHTNCVALVQLALEQLDGRERFIVEHRAMADEKALTYAELGAHFGCSRERIRQLDKRAMEKLRILLEERNT